MVLNTRLALRIWLGATEMFNLFVPQAPFLYPLKTPHWELMG